MVCRDFNQQLHETKGSKLKVKRTFKEIFLSVLGRFCLHLRKACSMDYTEFKVSTNKADFKKKSVLRLTGWKLQIDSIV